MQSPRLDATLFRNSSHTKYIYIQCIYVTHCLLYSVRRPSVMLFRNVGSLDLHFVWGEKKRRVHSSLYSNYAVSFLELLKILVEYH